MATTEIATARRGYTEHKDQLLTRLRRIEGQTRGIQGMVEDDRWCPDILQQSPEVQAALGQGAAGVEQGHVGHCMAQGSDDPKRREAMTDELMQALGRLVHI